VLIPKTDKWADQKQVTWYARVAVLKLINFLTGSQRSSDKREVAELLLYFSTTLARQFWTR